MAMARVYSSGYRKCNITPNDPARGLILSPRERRGKEGQNATEGTLLRVVLADQFGQNVLWLERHLIFRTIPFGGL